MGYVEDLMLRYYFQNKSLLPDGFLECEYLESTGTQWIETGIQSSIIQNASSGILFLRAVYSPVVVSSNYVLQARSSDILGIAGTAASSGIASVWDNASITFNTKREKYRQYDHVITYNVTNGELISSVTVDGNTTEKMSAISRGSRVGSQGTFKLGKSNNNIASATRFYIAELAFNRVHLLNAIPALCKKGMAYTDGNTGQIVTASANKPGMFDTITKKFFVNQGTGADFLYKYTLDVSDIYDKGTNNTGEHIVRSYAYTVPNGTYTVATDYFPDDTIGTFFVGANTVPTWRSDVNGLTSSKPERTVSVTNGKLVIGIRITSTVYHILPNISAYNNSGAKITIAKTA